ncbi:MAG: glycosyltransferase family 4 protein [Microcoleaceae cyanobacterium]
MKPLKILLSAYSCRPGMGSEPGVGWNMSQALAQYHRVWVLTRADNRPMIEAEMAERPVSNLHFIYSDLPESMLGWKQGSRGVYLHYYLWQVLAYFTGKRLHAQETFDVVHHVTYVRYSSPSFLSLLPIPFVWGPVGGGETAPKIFWQDFSRKNRIYEVLRSLTHGLGERDPFTRLTAYRCALALGTTAETAKRLQQIGVQRVKVLSQLGLAQGEIQQLAQYRMPEDAQPPRFISIGRLLHWKGFHLGLQAFAQANLPETAEYWMIGDGPERQHLQQLVEALGIASQVKFWNELPRDQTLQKLGQCLALVHPSLHESGGMVCLEAMAAGCPVICLDLGGPAIQVTAETGIKVPVHSSEQVMQGLMKAMETLARDREFYLSLKRAGLQKVQTEAPWDRKAKYFTEIYQEICSA